MAQQRKLYENRAAIRFRRIIRPGMKGSIANIEPRVSAEAGEALELWMRDLIRNTVRSTRVKDRRGQIGRQLNNGMRVTGRSSLGSLTGAIWTHPWLFAHEYGAHITPKRAEFLAIPIFRGLKPDGSPVFRNPKSWKRYGSFVYTSKDGRKFLAYRSGGKLKIIYVLVDSVDIPARLGLNQMSVRMLGQLISAWGRIYIRESWEHPDLLQIWGRRS